MLKQTLFFALGCLLLTSCAKDETTIEATTRIEPIPTTELNDHIRTSIESNGIFHWETVSDELLWSAAMQSDSIFAIGYQPAGTTNLEQTIHLIDIEVGEWKAARDKVLQVVLEGEKASRPDITVADILPFGMPEVLPTMAVHFTNLETVNRLRALPELRYLEAMGFELPVISNDLSERSNEGCGSATPNYGINSNDYSTISPNVKQPWNHASSNITNAWNNSTGEGVTITVIDTGASYDQDNLGGNFNSGQSQGRSVEKYSTHYSGSWWWRSLDSPHDQCGHGTQMSGLATAPRGGDGNSVGIAYNSDLIAIRAVKDVIISSSNEKNGVKNALVYAGNRSDVRVISMSIGTPFWSGTVADGVYYAYNQGKMMTCAAGTSFSWTSWWGVIFPANMSQTVAVTGVKDSESMVKCNTCHDGSAVDFVMVMQRASNNDRTTLTLATYSDQPTYVGGSSAATASVAGIASLIWAQNPNASRSQVYNAMKTNASFYPNANNNFGWGIIDAGAAVNTPL